jgi:hypothetical protein
VTADTAAGVDELDVLLERLGKRGYLFHAFRNDQHGPEVLAAVLDVGGTADVLILFDEDHAVAYRTPTGPGVDTFAPTHIYWWYASSAVWTLRAVLTLAPPGHPDAAGVLLDAPPDLGLPAAGRMPVRIRAPGWRR